jgi:hypothetical protein
VTVICGVNKAGPEPEFFVPLCASFVPWSFWKRLVINRGISLTNWEVTAFLETLLQSFVPNEKARQRRANSLISLSNLGCGDRI